MDARNRVRNKYDQNRTLTHSCPALYPDGTFPTNTPMYQDNPGPVISIEDSEIDVVPHPTREEVPEDLPNNSMSSLSLLMNPNDRDELRYGNSEQVLSHSRVAKPAWKRPRDQKRIYPSAVLLTSIEAAESVAESSGAIAPIPKVVEVVPQRTESQYKPVRRPESLAVGYQTRIWEGAILLQGRYSDIEIPCFATPGYACNRKMLVTAIGWPPCFNVTRPTMKTRLELAPHFDNPCTQWFVQFFALDTHGSETASQSLTQLAKYTMDNHMAFEIDCLEDPLRPGKLYLWGFDVTGKGISLMGAYRPLVTTGDDVARLLNDVLRTS
uniref:Uncharacterized protein n=1 Tax=Compsopogon caeruleus TaxID=31354 RepID=A0A7S1THF4_9RHOD|mmetsp:Transcript_7866/g.15827  ORF Transcript_7866/g.15827 Transcript_7866/m.15827 type:complete len:325 (+) Transcript_7866:221-1195(+)